MTATDLTPTATAVLGVAAELHARREVATVQALAIGARTSYMEAYDIVNQLFSMGLLRPDLTLTEAGRTAAS